MDNEIGFRVMTVPEPGMLALSALAALASSLRRTGRGGASRTNQKP